MNNSGAGRGSDPDLPEDITASGEGREGSVELLVLYEARVLELWEGLFEKRGPAQLVARIEYQRAYEAYKHQLEFAKGHDHGGGKR